MGYFFGLLLFSFILHSHAVNALDSKPVLNLSLAKKMADACEVAQETTGYRKISIAIVDAGADLILFRRQDGAFLGSIDIAIDKAVSSVRIPYPTRIIAEIVFGKDGNPGRVPGLAHSPGLVAFPGGLPIRTKSGELLGAIGVSGATGDEDETCAQAALDSISNDL